MNQEWYCTGKVIAQITICIYHFNLRRAQDTNLEFHQRGSDATVVYNNMPASALDKVVTFAVDVLCERKPRLQLRRRRLLANELTCANQVNQKYHMHKMSKRKTHFLFPVELSTQIDYD